MSILGISLLFSCILFSSSLKSSYLTTFDKDLLKSVFNTGYSKGFLDVQSVALSTKGYALLENTFDREKEACNLFKSTYLNSENINELYAAAYGASLMKSEKCNFDVTKHKKALAEIENVGYLENLFKVVKTLNVLNLQIDVEAVKKSLEKFLKKDSSALSQAYSYYIASTIFKDKTDLKKYFVEIEDTIQQADESDNINMYFEEGVYTTAFIINSIFELCEKYEEAPPIPMDKINKFSNFLLSRRSTNNLKTAVELTGAIKFLSKNKFKVPLVISLIENSIYKKQPKVKISVTNLWGDKIDDATLIAETVKNVQSATTIMSRKSLVYDSATEIYELDLISVQEQLTKGFYSIKLDIKTNETRNNEVIGVTLVVKVISQISVDNVELSIKERDQITGILNYKLTMGSLLSDKLSMNWHHRLDMKFAIRDNQQLFKPHQVFVKLTHYNTKQEIIFVVEADRTDVYKFNLDLDKSNKDFDNLSGDYKMELVVGDSMIETPASWTFANIKLDMPSSPSTENTGESRRTVAGSKRSVVNPRIGSGPSLVKPQIFHMFKPAEKRGGQLISTVFTILCIVPPFMLMLVLWLMVGVNVSNFSFGLSSIMFHVGIIAIFGLYYCYWGYLNMFTTLQCLLPLGMFTAFFGNRVLRQIASKRKEL